MMNPQKKEHNPFYSSSNVWHEKDYPFHVKKFVKNMTENHITVIQDDLNTVMGLILSTSQGDYK